MVDLGAAMGQPPQHRLARRGQGPGQRLGHRPGQPGPDSRTTATPARPGALARAKIVNPGEQAICRPF